jgi:predicted  nucleic acid-binding Zn-ribbon protein
MVMDSRVCLSGEPAIHRVKGIDMIDKYKAMLEAIQKEIESRRKLITDMEKKRHDLRLGIEALQTRQKTGIELMQSLTAEIKLAETDVHYGSHGDE